ncbi:tetratricopeptide repeat protein, partial [Micromonospora sp. NPDC048909]|uniref:tetratricopeptide repeat protein n=1 Tax=Micromonospora sp. NPDC048909 TaxID=3155643 RepID=UPI0033F12D44
MTTSFLARTDEQDRFRALLRSCLRDDDQPDHGYFVLVHGHGGIGKSELLRRYREIAAGTIAGDEEFSGRFQVSEVDCERVRDQYPDDHARPTGPPLWRILDAVYEAVEDGLAHLPDGANPLEEGFAEYRQEIAQYLARPDPASPFPAPPTPDAGSPLGAALGVLAQVGALFQPTAEHQATPGLRPPLEVSVPAVDRKQYLRMTQPLGAIIRAFAKGVRRVAAAVGPLVVTVDTAEILGDLHESLREVARRSGSRIVWVFGMRMEDEADSDPIKGELVRINRAIPENRRRIVALSRFDDSTVAKYLAGAFGDELPRGVTVDAVARLTRGIPLALQLIVDLLRTARLPAEIALAEVSPAGEVSEVIAGLATRYLVHAERPELREDLELIFGLALIGNDTDRNDAQLLASLWNVDRAAVDARREALARRHDYVQSRDKRLHQDVRAAIRLYLLDPVRRGRVADLNRRVVDLLRQRLTDLACTGAVDQLADDGWCRTTSQLVWHTFWLDPEEGLKLLAHVLPAAQVLRPPFAATLLNTSETFEPFLPEEQRRVLATMRVLAPASPFLRRLHTLFAHGDAARHPPDRSQLRRTIAFLKACCAYPGGILVNDVPMRTWLDAFRVLHPESFGLDIAAQAATLIKVMLQIPERLAEPTELDRRLAAKADEVAQLLIFTGPHKNAKASPPGLRLGLLGTSRDPTNANVWRTLGIARREAGDSDGALAAFDQAIRLNPKLPNIHVSRAFALMQAGRYEEALAAYDDAFRLDPDNPDRHAARGATLGNLGRHDEALTAYDHALRFGPDDPFTHHNRGVALERLGRRDDALAAYDHALQLDPDNPDRHAARGAALANLGRPDDALAAYDHALQLDPDNPDRHAARGAALADLGRLDDALAAYDHALQLDPDNPITHHNRGVALERLGRRDDAL